MRSKEENRICLFIESELQSKKFKPFQKAHHKEVSIFTFHKKIFEWRQQGLFEREQELYLRSCLFNEEKIQAKNLEHQKHRFFIS